MAMQETPEGTGGDLGGAPATPQTDTPTGLPPAGATPQTPPTGAQRGARRPRRRRGGAGEEGGAHFASLRDSASQAAHAAAEAAERPVTVKRGLIVAIIVLAVVLGVLLAMLVGSFARCSATQDATTTQTSSDVWEPPYTWDNMRNDENGLLAYYDANGTKLSEAGIDVSEHDGTIDWDAVADAGVDFVMVRLGYRGYSVSGGDIYLDDQFYNNVTGAAAAGLKVGVYFFSQAVSEQEAIEEANFVLDTLANVNVQLAYPIAFDEELHPGGSDPARTDGLTSAQLTSIAKAYLTTISAAGYDTIIYGNQNDLARLDLKGELAGYELWYAEYGVNHPTGQYDMAVWQYTETGTIPGTNEGQGATDINIRFIRQ